MKILVIQHKMIGDVLTSSILFDVLRKEYPEAQLEYLVNENTLAVVENNPNIDQVHTYLPVYDQNIRARKAFYAGMEQEKYELIIDVYAKLRSARMCKAFGPKQSVSYHKWYTSFCYKKTVKPATTTSKDEGLAITNRMLLLEELGISSSEIPKPKIYLQTAEIEQAKQNMAQAGISNAAPVFMIGAFGSNQVKTYPIQYKAKVLDELVATTDATLLFNYIPSQKQDLEALIALCNTKTQQHSRADVYGAGLRDFLALCSQCDALIGNEGGAVNMAKALAIPSFSIFSPWILKSAWNSYEASGFNASIHLSDLKPELYQKHPKKYKKKAAEMYQELLPEFVMEKLNLFLDHHGFAGSKP